MSRSEKQGYYSVLLRILHEFFRVSSSLFFLTSISHVVFRGELRQDQVQGRPQCPLPSRAPEVGHVLAQVLHGHTGCSLEQSIDIKLIL